MSIRVAGSGYARRDITAVAITLQAAWTICTWVKRINATSFGMIEGLHNSTSSTSGTVFMHQNGNNLTATHDASGTSVNTATIVNGTWFFCGLRTDGTNLDQFYALLADTSLTTNNSAAGVGTPPVANFVTAGGYYDGSLGFDGEFAQFRVWTRKLSDAELIAEKNSNVEVSATNLYLSWPMASASDTSDHSGNSRIWTAGGSGLVSGASDPANNAVIARNRRGGNRLGTRIGSRQSL